jgi:hypothetical protein
VKTEQSRAVPPQTPAVQVSTAVQNLPSLHADPFGSLPVQLLPASLQLSAQLASPSGPGHGLPACTVQAPAAHVSAPLQNVPSLHDVPVCAVQVPGVVPLQVWQSVGSPPPQALVQQTPSTHVFPAWHWFDPVQVPPGPFFAVHVVPAQ